MSNGQVYQAEEIGTMTPKMTPTGKLTAGEVGYVIANIKDVGDTQVGDTITEESRQTVTPFPGFQEIKPLVFAGLYPVEPNQYEGLRDALDKLQLNDSSFFYEPETSTALGFGFRCGFLGLLHMEIVQERLEREFELSLISTAPSVRYRILGTDGEITEIENPTKFPDPQDIDSIEEPIITALVMTRDDFLGRILKLLEDKRGTQKGFEYVSSNRVLLTYEMPLNEIVLDFYDRLKSVSKGYASLDYHLSGYRVSKLVKLDIMVAGESVDALSWIVHQDFAYDRGRALVEKMKTTDTPTDVRGRHPGRNRKSGDRPRVHPCYSQERHGKMLRRGHQPKTQAAGTAKRRQAANETSWQSGHPSGSVPRRAEDRLLVQSPGSPNTENRVLEILAS